MTHARAKRAEAVFLELMDFSATERTSELEARCNGDAQLRAEVEALLSFHDKDAGMLDAPPVIGAGLGLTTDPADHGTLAAGTRLGEYTIERTLGEGGMGVVYVARQERPRRTVALKVIRRGLATASLVRRFEHEAEVLGRLQHPGIAQIYEAGTAPIAGQPGAHPYIAMELINGQRLTDYAGPLPTRAKLDLLARVCAAVQHAHQRGIIHRDLKPANILVDEAGQPKVLDFGVARAADADLRVTTMQTSVGQLIGTLPYMSPEQVLADPGDVDTRSDVYALGVILYQVLAGKLPHDLSSRSIPEAARVIRDEEPAKLSSVSRIFRGDIDIIVSKAIEKDRNRRYQSAAELGADLERHLRGEPIAARADSPLYILKKQLRRYRMLVGAAGVVMCLLIAFAGYAAVQAERQHQQALREHDLLLKSDQAAARLADELSFSTIGRGRLLGLAGNEPVAERLIWSELFAHPDSRAAHWALWEFYSNNRIVRTLPDETYTRAQPAFSPDGSLVALARTAKTVSIMAADLSREVLQTSPMRTDATAMCFSPDGKVLAIGTGGGSLRLVDPFDGHEVLALPTHRTNIASLSFSPDGKLLASGSTDGSAQVCDLAEGKRLHWYQGPTERVSAACFSPDGRSVIFGYQHGAIHRLDASDLEHPTPGTVDGTIGAMAWSADGQSLYVGDAGHVNMVDAGTLTITRRLASVSDDIRGFSLSADGTRLLVAGGHGAELWDTQAWTSHILAADDPVPLTGAINPRSGTCILNTIHGKVQLWELPGGGAVERLGSGEGWLASTVIDPRGTRFVTASTSDTGRVIAWDLATGAKETVVGPPGRWYRSLAYSADGTRLAVGSADGLIKVWTADTLEPVTEIQTHAQINSLCFGPGDDSIIVAPGAKGSQVTRWGLKEPGGSPMTLAGVTGPVYWVTPRPGGHEFATSGGTPSLAVWDAQTNTVRGSVTGEPVAWVVVYSPDGKLLACTARARNIEVRDADTLKIRATLVGHVDQVLCCAFSSDGQLLASCSSDGVVMLWEVATGRQLATLFSSKQQLSTVVFTPDWRRLIVGGSDRILRQIDLSYHDRNIAGNLGFMVYWHRRFENKTWDTGELEAWARTVK